MDLSKLEISLLLFSDLIRSRQEFFKKRVIEEAKLNGFIGSNFFDSKKLEKKKIENLLKAYDRFVFEKVLTLKSSLL